MPIGFGQLELLRDTWGSCRRVPEDRFSVGTEGQPRVKSFCGTGANKDDNITLWGARLGVHQLVSLMWSPGRWLQLLFLKHWKINSYEGYLQVGGSHDLGLSPLRPSLHRSLQMPAAQWDQLSLWQSSIVAENKTEFCFLSRSHGRREYGKQTGHCAKLCVVTPSSGQGYAAVLSSLR